MAEEENGDGRNGEREKSSKVERFLGKENDGLSLNSVGVFGLALLFLFAGFGISLSAPKHPEIQSLIDACLIPNGAAPGDPPLVTQANRDEARRLVARGADACRVAAYQFERDEHAKSELQFMPLVSSVLSSLGLALLVALVVSSTIESRNRKSLIDILDQKTRQLSEAVMRGMFNRRLPSRLIDLVSENILQRELIRNTLSVNYVFTQWVPPVGINIARLAGRRFIAVKATLTTVVENVVLNEPFGGKVANVPICLVLPNPMLDELKSGVEISQVLVNEEAIGADQLKEVNDAIQTQLKDDSRTDVLADFGSRKLLPKQKMQIQLVYTMIKELEDSELFQTLQIAKGLSIVVFDNTGWDLKIRAKPISFGKLSEVSCHDSTRHWQINDLLLPHQGVLIWWKEKLTAAALPAGAQKPTNNIEKPEDSDGAELP